MPTTTKRKPKATKRTAKRAPLTDQERAAAEAARTAALEAATATMAAEVAKLRTSDDWQRWLATAARFHTYSWNNVFLAMCQAAERGMAPITRLAGFHAWLDVKRSVVKGQRGLKIFRPVLVKYKPADKGYDPSNPDRRHLVGFTLTSVFDIQQTEGEPLPERPTFTFPSGQVPFGLWSALLAYATSIGFPARFGHGLGAEGYTDPQLREIVIDTSHDNDDARAAMILIHEIAHATLHMDPGYDYKGHRGVAETEAESVAYLVGSHFGIDVGEQSFHYVAGWAPDLDTVLKVGERIVKTAQAIIAAVEPDVVMPTEPVAEPVAEPEPVVVPDCPTCHATGDESCKRPSGRKVATPHVSRTKRQPALV